MCAPRSSSWFRRASSLKLLFIIDPLDSLKAYKDTSVAMMRAAQARGHGVHVCEQQSLRWTKHRVVARAREPAAPPDRE